jgi:hypothetical protein
MPGVFRVPDCTAYWSLEPTGDERLSPEDAENLGFPSLEIKLGAWCHYWDDSVYAGLSQFHQSKGFNPYSQDVARHLGYRLYKVSDVLENSFVHGELIYNINPAFVYAHNNV